MGELLVNLNGPGSGSGGARSESQLICDDFCDRYGYRDIRTRTALLVRIQQVGSRFGLDVVRRLVGEVNFDPSTLEPIKRMFLKLREALEAA